MENKRFNNTYVLLLTLIVGLIDIVIIPKIYPSQSLISIIIFDCIVVVVCGILGASLAVRENIRLLYIKNTSETSNKIDKYGVVIFTAIFILINTFIFLLMYKEASATQSWIKIMTPLSAVLLSLRAAITEEIIFRLFLFTLIMIIVKKFCKSSNTTLILSSVVSAIIFSILLHQGSITSMVGGLLLAYVFYKKGIVQAMIVHFIVDLIPFMMIAVLNIS